MRKWLFFPLLGMIVTLASLVSVGIVSNGLSDFSYMRIFTDKGHVASLLFNIVPVPILMFDNWLKSWSRKNRISIGISCLFYIVLFVLVLNLVGILIFLILQMKWAIVSLKV